MPLPPRLSLPILPRTDRATAAECEESAPHPNEFPAGAAAWDDRLSRRTFLSIAGASLALAGVGGCSDKPDEPIVPYVDPPEGVVAGEPQFFATTLTRGGYARGVIVTSREGRPVKIEGNPDHPASLGAADAQMQAAVLGVYDPKRSNAVLQNGQPATWGAFVTALRTQSESHANDAGDGLRILTGATTSPTIARLMADVAKRYPAARWHAYEPLGRYNARAGVRTADGTPAEPVYDLTAADVIVSFDADFLWDDPGALGYARQFAAGRQPNAARPAMNRFYAAESDVSLTGTRADHRLPASPSRVGALIRALAAQFELPIGTTPPDLSPAETAWLSAASSDLHRCRGRSVVIAGDAQPPAVHAAALAINQSLGNVDATVHYIRSPVLSPDAKVGIESLRQLCNDMRADRVRTLLILADNPARTAPADFDFASALQHLSSTPNILTAHLGSYANETAARSQWHVPAQHELEQWSDATAFDGRPSIGQPLIAPMNAGRSPIDVLNILLGSEASPYETVRSTWTTTFTANSEEPFNAAWSRCLKAGVIDSATAGHLSNVSPADVMFPANNPAGVQILLRPDYSILDGSLFHHPWLQELPRPLTKVVWGNAALISPATAERNALKDEDVVRLQAGDRSIELPVLIQPGIAADTVVLHLGYGQHALNPGSIEASATAFFGVDVYPLRTSDSLHTRAGVTLATTGRSAHVTRTRGHFAIAEGETATAAPVIATPRTTEESLRLKNRKLVRSMTLTEFGHRPAFAGEIADGDIKSLYPAWDYSSSPQWGMTIDLNACIGCQACVIACQAENNTPSVGPEQVDRQREMHWLRIDSYGDAHGNVYHQPVPCMHCENAPCEYVCPVAATTHSVDGLNQMTYNRCVGTRYCSNNCPYKVRRFNFLNYTANTPKNYAAQRNPDVTVRTRGVMEKCTYCVQRLVYADRKAEIAAIDAGDNAEAVRRQLLGRVETACQQTCPTQAITFGNIADATSAVAHAKQDPRNYGILTELSTKPHTTYLAAVTNPSPSLETTP